MLHISVITSPTNWHLYQWVSWNISEAKIINENSISAFNYLYDDSIIWTIRLQRHGRFLVKINYSSDKDQTTRFITWQQKRFLFKVVDSCWISSTEWSDTFRSIFVYGKKQESWKKKYVITVQKKLIFLRRFNHKNTVFGISRNLMDKFVFKWL